MGYLPDFEHDIFISYSHRDNRIAEDERGWIDIFDNDLGYFLERLLGADVGIWRDKRKIRENEYFADTLSAAIPRVAILVSVLSPGYINSEWCKKELQRFCEMAERTGGLRFEDNGHVRGRIFKIIKTEVPLVEQPKLLHGMSDYQFYTLDPDDERVREFSADRDSRYRQNYRDKVSDLAHDLRDLMKCMRGSGPQSESRAPRNQPPKPPDDQKAERATIYLAEGTFDQSLNRDKIRRELQQRQYDVLPHSSLPLNSPDLQATIRDCLNRSTLSIHIIGEKYGTIPEGESKSLVCLQNDLAAERSEDPTFSRLIWMPIGLAAKEPRQLEFIEYLQNDSAAQKGAEILQTPLEELKTFIEDRLNPRSQPNRSESETTTACARVYLICTQQDFDEIGPLDDYLFKSGLETRLPLREEDLGQARDDYEAQMREDHKENLLWCDAVLIYYRSAGELWIRQKLSDLQKIAGYGRSRPMLAGAIYVTGSETSSKQRLRTHVATVIRSYGEFSSESLKPFVDQVEAAKTATITRKEGGYNG